MNTRHKEAISDIDDTERRLIFTTDIAECGINVKDLDVVVDLGEKFTYVYEGGFIFGQLVGVTAPSRVQRRGRVGRSKPGTYYECVNTLQKDYISAAEFDAQLLATSRAWTDEGQGDWDIVLSDGQFKSWLDDEHVESVNWTHRNVPPSRSRITIIIDMGPRQMQI